jgi:hypothetical protein
MTMQNINLGRAFGAALAVMPLISGAVVAETAPAPADIRQEEAFLSILPQVEVPEDVKLIPGAVNEEFRNCRASWPDEFEQAQSGPEARALRDIYGLVQARNVVSTQDCTCAGKVASWADVQTLAEAMHQDLDVQRLTWQHTKAIAEEADRLTAVAETMCGGSF